MYITIVLPFGFEFLEPWHFRLMPHAQYVYKIVIVELRPTPLDGSSFTDYIIKMKCCLQVLTSSLK